MKSTIQLNSEHVLSVLIANQPSATERLTNLLRRRAPDLAETTFVSSEEPGFARVTIALKGELKNALLLLDQIRKLIDVAEAELLEEDSYLGIQLALLRIEARGFHQDDACYMLRVVGARVRRQCESYLIAEMSDTPRVIEDAVERLKSIVPVTWLKSGLVTMPVR